MAKPKPFLLGFAERDAAQDRAIREDTMRWLAAAFVLLCTCALATAQDEAKDYPNRTIRIVVPFPAGGPADLAARIIAQKMSEDWGQPVVIENRGGGKGTTMRMVRFG